MASNLLQSIGQGLRIGAGAGNENIFNQQNAQDENARNRDSQKNNLMAGIIVKAVQNNAMAPKVADEKLRQMGFEGLTGFQSPGPSLEERKFEAEQFDAQRKQASEKTVAEHLGKLPKDISLFDYHAQAANAYTTAGLNERADNHANLAKIHKQAADQNLQIRPVATGRSVGGKAEFQDNVIQGIGQDGQPRLTPIGEPYVKSAASESTVNINTGQSPTDAAKTQLVKEGSTDLDKLRNLVMPNGKPDYGLIAGMGVPGFAGVPHTESRTAYSLLFNAIEAKLRAESGAAVPEAEVRRIADRFKPSILDSAETVQSKMDRLDSFLKGTFDRIKNVSEEEKAEVRSGASISPATGQQVPSGVPLAGSQPTQNLDPVQTIMKDMNDGNITEKEAEKRLTDYYIKNPGK